MTPYVNRDRAVRSVVVGLVLSALTACGKKEDQAATQGANGAVIPSATTGQPTALQVSEVRVGKKVDANKQISDQADNFSPKDTIYASVHTTGAAQNAQIVGRFTFQDGQVVDERTESISPTGDAYTEFHIAKPSGWPAGKYTVHILVNGKEVQTKDFTVK